MSLKLILKSNFLIAYFLHIFATDKLTPNIMEKIKLIQARTKRGFTQLQMAEALCIDVSNYNRREKGQIKITNAEWEKISKTL